MQTQSKRAVAGPQQTGRAPPSALSTSSSTSTARGDDPSHDSRPTTSNPALVSTLDKATSAADGPRPATHSARSDSPTASELVIAAHESTPDALTLGFPTTRLGTPHSAAASFGTSSDAGIVPVTLPRSSNVGPDTAKTKRHSSLSRSRSAQAAEANALAPLPPPMLVAASAPLSAQVLSPLHIRVPGPTLLALYALILQELQQLRAEQQRLAAAHAAEQQRYADDRAAEQLRHVAEQQRYADDRAAEQLRHAAEQQRYADDRAAEQLRHAAEQQRYADDVHAALHRRLLSIQAAVVGATDADSPEGADSPLPRLSSACRVLPPQTPQRIRLPPSPHLVEHEPPSPPPPPLSREQQRSAPQQAEPSMPPQQPPVQQQQQHQSLVPQQPSAEQQQSFVQQQMQQPRFLSSMPPPPPQAIPQQVYGQLPMMQQQLLPGPVPQQVTYTAMLPPAGHPAFWPLVHPRFEPSMPQQATPGPLHGAPAHGFSIISFPSTSAALAPLAAPAYLPPPQAVILEVPTGKRAHVLCRPFL